MTAREPPDLLPTKWRKKPVVIEAVQWFKHGDHPEVERAGRLSDAGLAPGKTGFPGADGELWDWMAMGVVGTAEGRHLVTPGDWIIKGVAGEFYPCKPDIFALTYEPADSPPPPAPETGEVERVAAKLVETWSHGIFGVLRDDGTVEELQGDKSHKHPRAHEAQWWGGVHDGKIAAAVAKQLLAPKSDAAPTEGGEIEGIWAQAQRNHAAYSATGDTEHDIRFFTLGLVGEAGEVANFVKKRWRDGDGHDDDLRKECADVLAYLMMLANALGMTPASLIEMVAYKQQVFVKKMEARKDPQP